MSRLITVQMVSSLCDILLPCHVTGTVIRSWNQNGDMFTFESFPTFYGPHQPLLIFYSLHTCLYSFQSLRADRDCRQSDRSNNRFCYPGHVPSMEPFCTPDIELCRRAFAWFILVASCVLTFPAGVWLHQISCCQATRTTHQCSHVILVDLKLGLSVTLPTLYIL